MIRPNRRLSFILLLIAAGILAGAAKPPAPQLIPADAADVTTLLPPPPAADSPEAKAELDLVQRTQQNATDAEKTRAKSEKKLTLAAFTAAVGPWFTADNLPLTNALLKQLESDSKYFTTPGKDHFQRPRPCDADPRISDITHEEEKEFSYPSGHSTRATLYAAVLAELLPDLKDKLLARSQQIGWDRIIAGVHYPSDILAGRVLGQSLAKATLANPAFKPELQKIRHELAAAQQKAPAPAAH